MENITKNPKFIKYEKRVLTAQRRLTKLINELITPNWIVQLDDTYSYQDSKSNKIATFEIYELSDNSDTNWYKKVKYTIPVHYCNFKNNKKLLDIVVMFRNALRDIK